MTRRFKLAAVAVLAVVAVGGVSAAVGDSKDKATPSASSSEAPLSSSGNKENPPADDVKLGAIATDQFGSLKVPVSVTNNTSKASNYSIQVEFLDAAGARLASDYAYPLALAPGQTAQETVGQLVTSDKTKQVKDVRLVKVDRYAAA